MCDSKEQRNCWHQLQQEENWEKSVYSFSDRYKEFLSEVKTEREGVSYIVSKAVAAGFANLNQLITEKKELKQGDKVYWVHQDKVVVLAVVGSAPLEKGVKLIGAHLDAPRLDLKPNPIYEEKQLALAKTHYYGGIKKYHWVGMPLALHGIVYLADGTKVSIAIGEKAKEPVFTVTDLLPHLAKEQMGKKMSEAIKGESLNILIGSRPIADQQAKEAVKKNVLSFLKENYQMNEEDFVSAELEVVPAGPARDVGLDGSMVGGYGQDDRACVYPLLEAMLNVDASNLSQTAVALFADKEEIGSTGSTGMQARIIPYFFSELAYLLTQQNTQTPIELQIKRCLFNSKALSADVNAADDPNYEGVLEKRHAAILGQGVAITKYTGVAGKAGASDANAEFINYVRRLFNKHNIAWQMAELGKVDQGGGGTIARFLAEYGMEVVDCGPPLLSMHSPFEVVSKADLYMTYLAYRCFFTAVKE